MEHLISLLAGLLIGGGSVYFITRSKLQQHYELNVRIASQNDSIERQNNELSNKKYELSQEVNNLEIIKTLCEKDVEILNQRKKECENQIQELQTQAKQAGEIFYEENLNLAQERLDNALEKIRSKYEAEALNYENEYLSTLNDLAGDFQTTTLQQQQAITILSNNLTELESKVAAAVEVNKRAEMERTQKDFYRLVLTDEDVAEIAILRQATKTLRNKEPINKVIWKVYYEKPYTDLIGRVVGNKVKTGIYKITNLENGMCYVGQAANIADRWKQHIKRGIGAEPLTRNKLYPAMLSIGVENFSFEIIEECDRSKLNELEDYWQDFYKAKEFGYSIK